MLILQEQSPQIPHLRHKICKKNIFSTLMKMLSNLAHCALQLFTRYMSRQWPDLHLMFIILSMLFVSQYRPYKVMSSNNGHLHLLGPVRIRFRDSSRLKVPLQPLRVTVPSELPPSFTSTIMIASLLLLLGSMP